MELSLPALSIVDNKKIYILLGLEENDIHDIEVDCDVS